MKKPCIQGFFESKGIIYQPSTQAKIKGATIVASLSTTNLGVLISSLPQVIFSLGTAPEYEP
jgi:hypothetical protein